jgi:hypothetical protein
LGATCRWVLREARGIVYALSLDPQHLRRIPKTEISGMSWMRLPGSINVKIPLELAPPQFGQLSFNVGVQYYNLINSQLRNAQEVMS